MEVRVRESLSQMNLSSLSHRCSHEMSKRRRKESFDDAYCLEIFRRAIVQGVDQAWVVLQDRFGDSIRMWLHSHPRNDVALRHDTEENYVAMTFTRFWHAVHDQKLEFQSLVAALSYLHATLNGIIMDTMRSQMRSKEVPLPEADSHEEPAANESDKEQSIWLSIQQLLSGPQEQRLAYLLYYCGLKPREVLVRCPNEFADIQEIYRLNCKIVERLRRNRDRLRWLLGDEEV
jgi:hypothetical protein